MVVEYFAVCSLQRYLIMHLPQIASVPVGVALVRLDPNLSLYIVVLAVLPNQFTLHADLLVIHLEGQTF